MPPIMGAGAFIMSEFLGMSYLRIAAAAIFPAVLYYTAIFVNVHVRARKRGLKGIAKEELPVVREVIRQDGHLLIPVVVVIAALLCGIAGATIATAQGAGFVRDMVAGRGFIALAALILGKWRPWPILLTCLGFGLLDAVAIRLQGVPVPLIGSFPVQAVQALPYLLTVILLAGFVGRSVPPKASGTPYVKER